MGDFTHENLQLVGRHVEDPWDGTGDNPHDTANPVTGIYEVGVLIDGVFKVIQRFKASGLFADIERAKQAAASTTPAEPAAEPPTQ